MSIEALRDEVGLLFFFRLWLTHCTVDQVCVLYFVANAEERRKKFDFQQKGGGREGGATLKLTVRICKNNRPQCVSRFGLSCSP